MDTIREKTSYALKWSLIAEILGKIIAPVSTMILARILTPDDFGVAATVTLVISFADMFSESGFHKFLVQHDFENDTNLKNSANVAFSCNIVISLLLWAIIFIFRDEISVFAGSPGYGTAIAVAGFSLPITSFSCIQSSLLRRRFDFKVICYARVISSIAFLVSSLVLVLNGLSYWALILGAIARDLVDAICLSILSRWSPRFVLQRKLFFEMVSFSMWSMLESLGTWFSLNIGTFIVAGYLNDYYLGLYKTTLVTVNGIFAVITSGTTSVLFSSLSRLQNDRKEYDRVYLLFTRIVAVIVIPLGVGMFIYRELATEIFLGDDWKEVIPFLGIYGLMSSLTVVLDKLTFEYFRGLGKPQINFVATVLYLPALIPTMIISAERGFLPAAYTFSVIKMEQVLVFWIILWFGFKFNPLRILVNIIKPTISAAIMGCIGYFFVNLHSGILSQICTAVLCAIIYFAVFIFVFKGKEDVALTVRMFTGKEMGLDKTTEAETNEKKKIAIIIQKLRGGGAERTAANLTLMLSDVYDVHLIVFDASEIKYPYKGTLHDLGLPPAPSRLGKMCSAVKRVLKISKIKKKFGISASISLLENANFANVLSKSNDRVIISVRNQLSKQLAKSFWLKKGMRYLDRKSDCIVSLSDGVKKDLTESYGISPDKIVTIYNPVDGRMLLNKAEIHKNDAEKMPRLSITTMGRLNMQKGQWHLIRAFKNVCERIPDAKLYILGEGELEHKLKALAEALELKENIVFCGFVEAPHTYIQKSRAFVFPSLFEGLGNVLLEAMACGTPCIAADCYSGPREIIEPQTEVKEKLEQVEYATYGILTSVCENDSFNAADPLTESEIQLADAMVHILKDDNLYLRYSKKSIERSNNFCPEKIKTEWINVIDA